MELTEDIMLKNPNSQYPQKNVHSLPKLLLTAIALILIVEVGFHLILPLLGIATVITVGILAGAWGGSSWYEYIFLYSGFTIFCNPRSVNFSVRIICFNLGNYSCGFISSYIANYFPDADYFIIYWLYTA